MSESPSSAYLAVLSGSPARVVRLAPGEYVAGRVPGATLLLTNMEISRRHCRFIYNGAQCLVEDMGSVRGTRVNGEKISVQTPLKAGDRIELGPVVIEFGRGEPPSSIEDGSGAGTEPGGVMLVKGVPSDRIPAQGEFTLGRDLSADVVLNDPSVSRRHATVQGLPGGGCVVRDLNSLAGSFVNGHRFDTHELTVGDRLQVGPFCFQYDGSALVRLSASRGSAVDARSLTQRVGARVLLDDLNFSIPSSHFVGILGPSGAGKSTLLNSLAGLNHPDGGVVFIDRRDIYASHEVSSFGYVPQDDIVHRELTVLQALRYSARLRLPASTPPGEIERLLVQTMEQLGLGHLAALPIHRLSGGQRKRVSVGVELLVRPAILFLDEPSSGLDPATEFQLMELLRDLADSGCTIVCTTHVIENAYLMDQLLVLMGGCLAFQGSAQEAREYFGVSKLIALYERLLEHPPIEWKSRLKARRAKAHDEPGPLPTPAGSRSQRLERGRPQPRFSLPILLQRQATIFACDWRNFALVLGEPLIVALLVAWVATEAELALFFAYLAVLWFGCSNAAQEVVKELPVFRREHLVGVGVHPYVLSKILFQFGLTAVQALLLYIALVLGSKIDGVAGLQLLSLLALSLVSVGIGTAISALARSIMQAVLVVPLILIPQILFSGFTVKASDMSRSVYAFAELMPSFSAQKLMETSFFWKQPIAGDLLSRHYSTAANLKRATTMPTRGAPYEQSGPIVRALLTLAAWLGLSYATAWFSLRATTRRK